MSILRSEQKKGRADRSSRLGSARKKRILGAANMHPSFRAFMARLIDYAGLFPPARLPLRQSLEKYLRYKVQNDSWMLGRYVCPAERLPEVSKLRDQVFSAGPPIEFAALGQGGFSRKDFLSNLENDLEAAKFFVTAMDGRALVDVFETRLPPLQGGADAAAKLLEEVDTVVRRVWPGELTVFFEATVDAGWKETFDAVIEALARKKEDPFDVFRPAATEPSGLKLRCGGEQAAAVPSLELAAHVVGECARRGVRFKATAGLHHPIRRFNRAVGGVEHGFLNLFGAGILARIGVLPAERIAEMLADQNPRSFRFEEDFFQWKDIRAETALMARARKDGFVSFGSCSFDEPRQHLRELGLLEEVTDMA